MEKQVKTPTILSLMALVCTASVASLPLEYARASERSQPVPWPVAIQQQLVVIHAVDFALRTNAAGLCNAQRGVSGIKIDALSAYPSGSRKLVEETTGLKFSPQVIGLVLESPAALAGVKVGDAILTVNGIGVASSGRDQDSSSELVDATQELVDGNEPGETVALRIDRGGEILELVYIPLAGCDGYSVLRVDGGKEAYSDRKNVGITTGMVEFVENEDQLAFLLAHELAHTIYGDSEKGPVSRRDKERRADLLATHLISCAGFESREGARFLMRLKDSDWQAAFRAPTHPSYHSRSQAISDFRADLSCTNSATLDALTDLVRKRDRE